MNGYTAREHPATGQWRTGRGCAPGQRHLDPMCQHLGQRVTPALRVMLQSAVSVAAIALVVARAVNILG